MTEVGTNKHINGQQKGENYILLGINAVGIKILKCP